MSYKISRYHDFSCGHRVYGHEGACAHIHGHNYRITFVCTGALDTVGRVIDFSVVKAKLCMWLEDNWDHKMLLWTKDPALLPMLEIDETVVGLPFNPTAENMAKYLVDTIGPIQLKGTGVLLEECIVEETRKCSASYSVPPSVLPTRF